MADTCSNKSMTYLIRSSFKFGVGRPTSVIDQGHLVRKAFGVMGDMTTQQHSARHENSSCNYFEAPGTQVSTNHPGSLDDQNN
ncbi:hypothetical protein D3C86_1717290 [compost metagenome]